MARLIIPKFNFKNAFGKAKQAFADRPFLTAGIFLIIILGGIAGVSLLLTRTAQAAWWNDNWQYRKRIPVTNNTTAETNVYIAFDGTLNHANIDTTSLDVQASCQDLRFTKENGELLPYKYNSGCGGSTTDVDVFFDTFPAGSMNIYMYYGNANAVAGQEASAFATEASNYTIGTIASEETTPGPVAYWAFNEGADNTCSGGSNDACDSTQNANDGAFGATTAAPAWQAEDLCIFGKCLLFDGSDDTTTVSNTVAGVQTISFWTKILSTSTTEQLIDLNGTDYVTSVNGTVTVNGFGTDTIYVDGVSGATTLTANKWHYVTITTTSGFSASAIKFGQISTNYGNIFLDEVKMYSYARSAAEIKTDYLGGIQGSSAVLGVSTQSFLSDGLVGYWKMDDNVTGNGATLTDSSGSGNNGTTEYGADTTGVACNEAGKFGSGCHMDGNDDNITAGTTGLSSTTGTVSIWVNHDDSGSAENIFTHYNSGNRIYLYTDTNSWYFKLGDNIAIDSTADLTPGTWGHLTLTWDNGTYNAYFNGSLVKTGTYSNLSSIGTCIGIGAFDDCSSTPSSTFDGLLDELRIYDHALSSSEVQALYNWGPGPVGYWNMNEGTGTSANDSSGNGQTGTLTNAVWTDGKYGNGVQFDGTGDFVDVGTGPSVVNSVSFWAKPASTTEYFVDLNGSAYVWNNAGTVTATGFTSPTIYVDGIKSTSLSDTTSWHHITVTTATSLNASDLDIGRLESTDDFEGKIDDVRIYNYARTSGQVVEDMNAGHPIGGSPVGSQVAYWSFDEQQGQTVNDVVGTNDGTRGANSGSSTDDPTWKTQTDCRQNGCLSFDGGDYVNVGDKSTFEFGSGDFSFSAWLKTTDSNDAIGLLGQTNGTTEGYAFQIAVGKLRMWLNGNTIVSNNSVNDGSWHHVAATVNQGGNTVLYIDGIADKTSATPSYTDSSGNPLWIGGWGDINYVLTGSLDEVKIYNTALTAEQVRIDMNAGAAINFGTGYNEADQLTDTAGNPPVAYWNFEEGNGQSANDTSGNGNTGTLGSGGTADSADPVWTNGKIGGALSFDGTNDYVATGTMSAPSGAQTYSAWIKTTQSGEQGILGFSETAPPNTTYDRLLRINSSNKAEFYVTNSAGSVGYTSTSTTSVNDGQWHHILGVTDGSNMQIYVDGVQEDSDPSGGGYTGYGTPQLNIGASNNSSASTIYFSGQIDQVKIYDYARTQSQVSYDYNRGRPIAWYKLDECQGSTANDSSGNSLSGTIATAGTLGTCTGSAGEMWKDGSSGKLNASLDFDGSTQADYVDIYSSAFNSTFDGNHGSISMWVKVNSAAWTDSTKRLAIDLEVDANNQISIYKSATDNILTMYRVGGATSYASNYTTSNTGWMHVVMTWDDGGSDEQNYYIDGQLIETDTSVGTFAGNLLSTSTVIGATNNSGGSSWEGQIDDVRIYNYALSQAQVRKIMIDDASARFD